MYKDLQCTCIAIVGDRLVAVRLKAAGGDEGGGPSGSLFLK